MPLVHFRPAYRLYDLGFRLGGHKRPFLHRHQRAYSSAGISTKAGRPWLVITIGSRWARSWYLPKFRWNLGVGT